MCTVDPRLCLASLFCVLIVIRYPNRTSLGLFIFRFHCAPAAELHVSGASCAPGARGAQRQTDSAHATTDIEMSYVTTAHQSPCRCHSRTHHGACHAGPTPRDATSSSEHKQDSTQTSHLTSPHSHKPAPSRRPRERRTSSVSDAPAYPQSYLCTRDVQRVPPLRLAHFVPATSPAAALAPWRHRQLLPLPSPAPSDG